MAVPTTGHREAPSPEQPYTIFDKRQKAIIVAIVSTAATFSGFASNIYFPAIPTIAKDLQVSPELINLSVTSYLVFQGLAPSLWGPISDVWGRRVAYFCTFLVFFGACIGLAETKGYTTLIILRCLQSTGSASTIAIGSGVIGDITTRAERGGYMGVFQAGLLVPVAVGPVIGGALAGSLGWRSIFWVLAVYGGIFLVCLIFLLPETLRSIVANGGIRPPHIISRHPLSVYQRTSEVTRLADTDSSALSLKKRVDLLGPWRILVSKQAAPLIFFLAIYYTIWQMSITAMSTLFEESYGLGQTEIGLTYIANGVGSMVGTLLTGKLLNLGYRKVERQYSNATSESTMETAATRTTRSQVAAKDDFPLEKARLSLVPIFAIIQCLSIVFFGWTINYPRRIPIALPIIATFVTGWTAVSTQSVIMTYLVDAFPDRSAAASASLNLARCLMAAGGTSFILPMVNGVGAGWAFAICSCAQIGTISLVAVAWKYGPVWRSETATTGQNASTR